MINYKCDLATDQEGAGNIGPALESIKSGACCRPTGGRVRAAKTSPQAFTFTLAGRLCGLGVTNVPRPALLL